MNWFDLLLVLFCGFFLWRGFQVGFIKSVLFYLSLLCGLMGSLYLEPYMYSKWKEWEVNIPEQWTSILSWIFLFVVIAVCVQGIGWGVRLILKTVLVDPLDRLLGFFLGVVKAFCFFVITCWSLSQLPKEFQGFLPLENSVIYKYAELTFPFINKTWENYKGTPFELKDSGIFREKKSNSIPHAKNFKSKKQKDLSREDDNLIENYPESGGSNWGFLEGRKSNIKGEWF